MAAVRIVGKEIAEEIRQQLTQETEDLKKKGITPKMALILVGDAQDLALYVRNKAKAAESVGAIGRDLTTCPRIPRSSS